MSRLLVIDNYDSFTYNLVHYIEGVLESDVDVIRNDEIDFARAGHYDCFVLSPGPGLPHEAGQLMDLIDRFSPHKIIFGVCLGMQAIALHYGGKLENLDKVYHGVASTIHFTLEDNILFNKLPSSFKVGRYHSWVVDKKCFPSQLEITSEDKTGSVMSLRHRSLPVFGVQFHPESILSEYGKKIIFNFLKQTGMI